MSPSMLNTSLLPNKSQLMPLHFQLWLLQNPPSAESAASLSTCVGQFFQNQHKFSIISWFWWGWFCLKNGWFKHVLENPAKHHQLVTTSVQNAHRRAAASATKLMEDPILGKHCWWLATMGHKSLGMLFLTLENRNHMKSYKKWNSRMNQWNHWSRNGILEINRSHTESIHGDANLFTIPMLKHESSSIRKMDGGWGGWSWLQNFSSIDSQPDPSRGSKALCEASTRLRGEAQGHQNCLARHALTEAWAVRIIGEFCAVPCSTGGEVEGCFGFEWKNLFCTVKQLICMCIYIYINVYIYIYIFIIYSHDCAHVFSQACRGGRGWSSIPPRQRLIDLQRVTEHESMSPNFGQMPCSSMSLSQLDLLKGSPQKSKYTPVDSPNWSKLWMFHRKEKTNHLQRQVCFVDCPKK